MQVKQGVSRNVNQLFAEGGGLYYFFTAATMEMKKKTE
jgi:hypothetical protein